MYPSYKSKLPELDEEVPYRISIPLLSVLRVVCIHPTYMQATTLFDKEGNMSTVASPGFKTVGDHLADAEAVLPTTRQSLALLQACSQSAAVHVCLYAYSVIRLDLYSRVLMRVSRCVLCI